MGMHKALLVAVAGGLLLVGCSGGGDGRSVDVSPTPSTSSSASSPAPSPSPSVSASAAVPSPAPTQTAAASTEPSPSAPAAQPQTASEPAVPPPAPDAPAGIPEQQSESITDFDLCSEQYLEASSNITVTQQITPVVIEGWTQAYQDASALAAEGDYEAAADACWLTVQEMQAALG